MKKPQTLESNRLRKTLLQEMIAHWPAAKYSSMRLFRKVLTAEEWSDYERKASRQPIPPIPADFAGQIKNYVDCLDRADRLEYRANNTPGASRQVSERHGLYPKKSLRDRADAAYEHALEILEELACENSGIACWFDRPLRFDQINGCPATAEDMPRLLTSRSQHALRNGAPKQSITSLRVEALRKSLDNIELPPDDLPEFTLFDLLLDLP